MTILLSRVVPREQLLIVHAPLGDVEWPCIDHIENTMPPGVPLILAPIASGKTLLERVEERGKWPDSARRWCTSDFMVTPIERELRRYLKAHPRFEGRLVSAMGLRRDESAARAKRVPWKRNDRNSRAGREWFDWLPVFALTTQDIFRVIAEAGQKPHWVYSQGISRCSCTFCIFGSRADLRRAAELRPGLYARYAQLEQRIDHTLSPSRVSLPQLTGIPVDLAARVFRPCDGVRLDRSATPSACPYGVAPDRSAPPLRSRFLPTNSAPRAPGAGVEPNEGRCRRRGSESPQRRLNVRTGATHAHLRKRPRLRLSPHPRRLGSSATSSPWPCRSPPARRPCRRPSTCIRPPSSARARTFSNASPKRRRRERPPPSAARRASASSPAGTPSGFDVMRWVLRWQARGEPGRDRRGADRDPRPPHRRGVRARPVVGAPGRSRTATRDGTSSGASGMELRQQLRDGDPASHSDAWLDRIRIAGWPEPLPFRAPLKQPPDRRFAKGRRARAVRLPPQQHE